jgi:sarcosine oxidase, subunit beta
LTVVVEDSGGLLEQREELVLQCRWREGDRDELQQPDRPGPERLSCMVTTEFPTQASVVVIGGGVMGLSTAYHLAAAGVRDVVLVERAEFGSGSTCRAAGGVRAQFSEAVNIELGKRSLRTFETFTETFGQEIDLHQVGYLFLLDDPDHVAAFEASVALQNELGVDTRMIDVGEAKRLSPLIETDGLLAAAYGSSDGHCTPESVVLGYAGAARRAGARLFRAVEVTGIDRTGDDIRAVHTSGGVIRTDTVICAAGAYSAKVGDMAGVHLPVEPLRRQVITTGPAPDLEGEIPFTIDFSTSLYFHRDGPGLLVGMSDPDETPGFKLNRGEEWLPRLSEAIERRAPRIGDYGIASGWAGLYEMTPDHNAIVGEAEGVSRFLFATGFSGHGFLMGPAIGEVMRDLYLGRQPVVDVTALDVKRFDSNRLTCELNIV